MTVGTLPVARACSVPYISPLVTGYRAVYSVMSRNRTEPKILKAKALQPKALTGPEILSERARPTSSTKNRVNGTDARLLDRRLGFGPTKQVVFVSPQN